MIEISEVEQYESVVALGNLLYKLGLTNTLTIKVTKEHGDDFERCDGCDAPHCECACNHEYWNDRYDAYSDEASYEE